MNALRIFGTLIIMPALLSVSSCGSRSGDQVPVVNNDSPIPAVEQDSVTAQAETDTTADNLTALFSDNVGQNVRDINFFNNATLRTTLTSLLGAEKFRTMTESWQTQTPIQLIEGRYVTGGMKDNSGANPGFTIVYNPARRNLSVAWVENGKTTIYQQQKEDIAPFIQFPAN